MNDKKIRSTRVEIDLGNLEQNIIEHKKCVDKDTIIFAVVKADAYGHGSVECCRVMKENGIDHFAVGTLDEAIKLRQAGFADTISVLGHIPDDCYGMAAEYDITVTLSSLRQAEIASKAVLSSGKILQFFAAADTGMSRIGWPARRDEDIKASAEEIAFSAELPGLKYAGITSHFADADGETREYTEMQLKRFSEICLALSEAGAAPPIRMIANSAASIDYPEAHFDAVRMGAVLYGIPASEFSKTITDLRPVMSIRGKITFLKSIPAGTSVGYGMKFTAERETRIATLSIGYADGYTRRLAGRADVLIKGKRAPVVGNICMDQIMVDVTDIEDVSYEDTVTIMGIDGDDEISAGELGAKADVIDTELMCLFGNRLPKVYIDSRKGK